MATPGGDVAELLDVDVDQGTGMGVLVAADGLAGGSVQLGEPADPAADQDGMDGGGGQADLGPTGCRVLAGKFNNPRAGAQIGFSIDF